MKTTWSVCTDDHADLVRRNTRRPIGRVGQSVARGKDGSCVEMSGVPDYFVNNLFHGCPGELVYQTDADFMHASAFSLEFLDATIATGGHIEADPLFVDAEAGDYRLSAGSPAIDAGYDVSIEALGAVSTDITGEPAPEGAGYDIGAYEYR